MVVEEDLRDRLGRSREEARKISSGEKRKIEEEEKSFRIRRRSREDNDTKMDLGMIVKTVVRDEHELNEMRKLEVDPEKEKYMEKERELAKQRLIDKEKRTFSQRFVLIYISWSIEARQAQKQMQTQCFDVSCLAKHVMCQSD